MGYFPPNPHYQYPYPYPPQYGMYHPKMYEDYSDSYDSEDSSDDQYSDAHQIRKGKNRRDSPSDASRGDGSTMSNHDYRESRGRNDRRTAKTDHHDIKGSTYKKKDHTHRRGETDLRKSNSASRRKRSPYTRDDSFDRDDGSIQVNATSHLPPIVVPDLAEQIKMDDNHKSHQKKESKETFKSNLKF